eukprot:scaffold1065_cov114-Skeletonema_dohrnii-CCMP3373.AAC.7
MDAVMSTPPVLPSRPIHPYKTGNYLCLIESSSLLGFFGILQPPKISSNGEDDGNIAVWGLVEVHRAGARCHVWENVKFKFVRERFDEHGILQGVGKSDKRYQHASYRYTIADKNKFFAPYEDLNIHEWVQCDSCDKWRKLPANISPDELPHEWHCTMNTWDTRIATCDASEEEED